MYGEGKNLRYIIGFAAVIILLFVIIFMIVRGGGDDKAKVPETSRELTSYTNDSNVTITTRTVGAIVAPQNHNEVTIDVTNSNATINIINGYEGNVINSRSYPLTTQAFGEFLSALDRAGFTEGNTDEALQDDSGYCATGQRYIFEIRDGSNSIQRFWSTSCRDTKTYRGNTEATLALFENQVPDYDEITENLNLGTGGGFLD